MEVHVYVGTGSTEADVSIMLLPGFSIMVLNDFPIIYLKFI